MIDTLNRNGYKVAQNPTDRNWYVVGDCVGCWIPVSNPYDTKSQAQKHLQLQVKADHAARKLCDGI